MYPPMSRGRCWPAPWHPCHKDASYTCTSPPPWSHPAALAPKQSSVFTIVLVQASAVSPCYWFGAQANGHAMYAKAQSRQDPRLPRMSPCMAALPQLQALVAMTACTALRKLTVQHVFIWKTGPLPHIPLPCGSGAGLEQAYQLRALFWRRRCCQPRAVAHTPFPRYTRCVPR
jgi:hypothetical protein